MHKILIIIMFFFFFRGLAQDTITYSYVNEKTYDYYLKGEWKSVCKLGMKGIKNDIDYYYLRARLGKSFFERGNYMAAARHFRKALKQNSADPFSMEYLYYSLINTGDLREAAVLRSNMSNELADYMKLNKKQPFIDDFLFEFATCSNKDFEEQSVINLENFPIGSKKNLTDNYLNLTILARHPLWKRVDYTHAITHLSLNGLEQSRPTGTPPFTPPPYIEDEQTVSQNQYFGNINFHISRKDDFSVGTHLLTSKTSITRGGRGNYGNIMSRENNGVVFVNYLRSFSVFKANLFLAKGNINLDKQYQGTATLYYFPFGNLNLYGSTEITGISENDTTNKIIWQQMAGFRAMKNTWLEFSYMSGDIKNYLDKGGLIVYNNTNTITSKAEGTIMVSFPKSHIRVYFKYFYITSKGDNFYSSINDANPTDYSNLNATKYHLQTITGGLLWNF
ncbi:MAG: hypothetical protein A2W91_13390 [Bacteroidetes bacterium GWF2_38_335]|nr:MAG: hypothetical protein A2W91_13390 [Bacteroidetes bacterium GWF2_38_335]OFY77246.1 MAG: hypothetical protein A2281_15055 [Bacteroidetes bacterium RIFOXYA12_FULL_38_20]HBS85750.1 hypothetical protein [Bacteroidales bacterium]